VTLHATEPAAGPAEVAAAIAGLTSGRPPLLVVVDFDGTLAPGSRDPGAAAIDPVAQRALRRLAALAASRPARLHVAVLTGRTVPDVAARVRVGGIEYLGDHGLQDGWLARGGRPEAIVVGTSPEFADHGVAAERLASGVAGELGHPGWLFVERKGPSVAFHVRQADDVAAARAAVVAAIARVEARDGLAGHGLEHYRGRSVVDLRPRAAGGKREAVERLIARDEAGAVVVLGDELSDVDAFEAVIAARTTRDRDGSGHAAGPSGVVGLTVAVHGSRPAPVELSAVADLHLASARAVGRFLDQLARSIAAERDAR